ncbi:MAG: hypothetical protein V4662_26925, partial [Verrucomicrobiota bacterium]
PPTAVPRLSAHHRTPRRYRDSHVEELHEALRASASQRRVGEPGRAYPGNAEPPTVPLKPEPQRGFRTGFARLTIDPPKDSIHLTWSQSGARQDLHPPPAHSGAAPERSSPHSTTLPRLPR